MPTARWPSRARPARASSSSSWSQILGEALAHAGKLAEAAELLDGGIEASRLLGNTHALVWSLSGRSGVALAMGDVELALATAQEGVDLSQDLDEGFHSAEAAVDLAAALFEKGQPEPAVELLLDSAGGEELVFIAGSRRALASSCSRAAGSRSTSASRRGARGRRRRGVGRAVQLPLARAWAERAAAEGRPARRRRRAGSRASARVSRSGRRGRSAGRGGAVTDGRRPGARQAGEHERAAHRATARGGGARGPRGRCATGTRRNASCGKLGQRIHRRTRRARPTAPASSRLTRARARGGSARRRPQDESRDRRRAVPQPEDRRDPPAQHLPQGRRLLTRRAGARRRARGSRRRPRPLTRASRARGHAPASSTRDGVGRIQQPGSCIHILRSTLKRLAIQSRRKAQKPSPSFRARRGPPAMNPARFSSAMTRS